MKEEIDQRIEEFKVSLQNSSAQEIVEEKILFGDCFILDSSKYHALRKRVATNFGLHTNDVIIVGSAKIGFSIAPHKRFQPFGNKSDIDVVIVSERLFDEVWFTIFQLWHSRIYWDRELKFKDYLFQGWIRPDHFPNSKKFPFSAQWWEFFRELTSTGEFGHYKISGAIYKNLNFVQLYQNKAVQSCIDELTSRQ